jgi:hypothetical protein
MTANNQRHERVKQRLLDDGFSPSEFAGLPDLDRWDDPEIDVSHKTQVLMSLQRPERNVPNRAQFALTLLKAQLRVVQRGVWMATAFSIVLGVIATLALYGSTDTFALALIAPLAAAAGIAFIYGPDADPPMEILLTVPTSPRLVLLARLVLVFAFDLALGLAATALLTGVLQVALWPLLTMWLAPMVFLSALAFFGSVMFADSLAGVMVSLCAWFVLCAGYLTRSGGSIVPDFTASSAQAPLWIGACALCVAAFWLIGVEEHWVRSE